MDFLFVIPAEPERADKSEALRRASVTEEGGGGWVGDISHLSDVGFVEKSAAKLG